MDLYLKRKEQMQNSVGPSVVDANNEIAKKRSSSPVIANRSLNTNGTNLKIAYKGDIEDIKKDIQKDLQFTKNDLINVKSDLDNKISEVLNKSCEMSAVIEKLNKSFDRVKNEQLKKPLSDAIEKQNENIKNLASELVSQLDKINVLQSQMFEIQEMLKP